MCYFRHGCYLAWKWFLVIFQRDQFCVLVFVNVHLTDMIWYKLVPIYWILLILSPSRKTKVASFETFILFVLEFFQTKIIHLHLQLICLFKIFVLSLCDRRCTEGTLGLISISLFYACIWYRVCACYLKSVFLYTLLSLHEMRITRKLALNDVFGSTHLSHNV